jgi:hypothetical protein
MCGAAVLVFTVTPAFADPPAERAEVASVEEGQTEVASVDETSPPLQNDPSQTSVLRAESDIGANSAAQNPQTRREPRLGGHVGVATPFVTISSDTTTIADQFTLLHPIGISVKFDKITVDFETVVVNPIEPSGQVGLVIDPGVIYNFGPAAAGLRLAWQQAESNFGLIPLVNKGITNIGEATWFVEAAFPTFYSDSTVQFNMVLHSGVGF